jgi:hypothetical protein
VYVRIRELNGQYGWTVHAANGKKLATSGEFYTRRKHTLKMARILFPTFVLRDEANKEIVE